MPSDLKKIFEKQQSGGFIKTSDTPVGSLTSEQKVLLNRKGNVLFNQGDIQNAKRLFITTGYSDGLTRVGDVYQEEGDILSALKFYLLAHNTAKSELLYEKIADTVSFYLKQKD
ncbi:hypothetical protein H0R92_00120 [Treponema sp. OMZ 840]|uniref:hypothetical protein n=1 Tax=Treponema sp. OMZ 840 TaxID=244313 RepID=UPI003D8D48B8